MGKSSELPVAVILLAGMGSRLGRPHPKALVEVSEGESILSRQVRILKSFGLTIHAVVGFKHEQIMEQEPDLLFAYNPYYDTTNTAKSLLCGLNNIHNKDVLWLNGDVVFEKEVIAHILTQHGNFVAGNHAVVGDEEVKYQLDKQQNITALSKQVSPAIGEAVGINMVAAETLEPLKKALAAVNDKDYFEKAIELLIEQGKHSFKAIDISQWRCLEVDFHEDLDAARDLFKKTENKK